MDYFNLFAPVVLFIIGIAAGSKAGDYISNKTGKKFIGWPIGFIIFIFFVYLAGIV